jgi:hypothetical protein
LAPRNSLPSGRDPEYEAFQAEQRKARRLLARMDRMEDMAEKWEHFAQVYTDVPKREVESRRQLQANSYRRLVGVMPEMRAELRGQLEELIQTGNGTVDSLVASVRDRATTTLREPRPANPFA